jgi:hypothetical protein
LDVLKRLPKELINNPDIQQIRDEVIAQAQTELLKFAKKELTKGNGIVVAVETLVRLRGIESLSETIEVKADGELKQLRDQLPRSAKQIINSANNFKPSKMYLSEALQEARRISNQLQAFLGIAADFPEDTWLELKESIDKHLALVSEKIEKLEKIQGILDKIQANGDMWKDAVGKDNFSTLKEKTDSLKSMAGGELLVSDIKEFTVLLTETIELRRHISTQFRRITEGENSLVAQEDYVEIIKLCKSLQNLPVRSSLENPQGEHWEKIKHNDYLSILQMAESDLNFFDEITENFLGEMASEQGKPMLETLVVVAAQRQADIQKWEEWLPDAEKLYNRMEMSHKATSEVFGGSLGVVKAWTKFQTDVDQAIAYFATEPAGVSSNKAKDLRKIKEDALKTMQEWKEKSVSELKRHEEFSSKKPPTIEELMQLSRNGNYFELAEGLIRAKFSPIDENYRGFVKGLETNRLSTVTDTPPLGRLTELKNVAEKCLGPSDSLTIQIEQKIADLSNPRPGIFGTIFGRNKK